VEELHGDPTVGPRPKVWTRGQKWRAGEAQMRDNPEGGELDPAKAVRRSFSFSEEFFSFFLHR